MTIAPDPKSDTIPDSDEEFENSFKEFASGKTPPDPDPEDEEPELPAPDGNGPVENEPEAPANEGDKPDEAAAEGEEETEKATSGDANKPDGGQPSEDQAPDPWAGLSDEQKELLQQLQREKDEALHRAQSDAARVSALSRKLHQLQMAGQPSGVKPQSEQPSEAKKALDEKVKQLREDYGEIADPLIELIEAQSKELSTVRATLEGLNEQQQAQVIAAETQALEERHPDWRNVAQSQDFVGWLQVQPDNIQRLAQSWDARETSVVLTLFKAERAEAAGQQQPEAKPDKPDSQQQPKPDAATGAKRSQQLDGGRDVRSKPAPAASGPPEDFDAAFNFFVQKRQQAAARR